MIFFDERQELILLILKHNPDKRHENISALSDEALRQQAQKIISANRQSQQIKYPMSAKEKKHSNKEEIFNPDKLDCCIEIGDCRLENPPKELIEKLIGKPISQCEKIIKEFLKPKEKLVIKFPRKIGFQIQNDNR